MKLLAVNAPQPPLPPTSKDYAPLLILQAVLGWLEAQPLAQTQAGLIETTPEIRDYLLSILHVMGFALSSLVERAQEGSFPPNPDPNSDPNPDSSPAWTDPFAPLAVPAAEIFVRLCAGTSKRLSMEQAKENSVSGAALYDKYKRMALPTVKGGETAAVPSFLLLSVLIILSILLPFQSLLILLPTCHRLLPLPLLKRRKRRSPVGASPSSTLWATLLPP